MKYAVHIPLIGGFALANMNVVGHPPIGITSYEPFYGNDSLLLRYLDKKDINVPYYNIDECEKNGEIQDITNTFGKLDFVSAVPPCSGLSMSSALKKGARSTAPANDWMYKSAEFVLGTLKPTVYMFENAPALYTGAGTNVRNNLMEIATKHGYAGTFYKTDSLLHGIPQRRPRTYTILVKGDKAPILNYFNIQAPSVAEYIKNIPSYASLQETYMSKEPFIRDFEIVKFITDKFGDNWRDEFIKTKEHLTSYDFLTRKGLLYEYRDYVNKLENPHPSSVKDINHVIKKVEDGKNYRLSHRVLCVDKHHVYAVIGEMMERNVHPTEDRRLNMREYMHLMGMPHDFEIEGKKEFGKLPQNVPVTTSEDITREVIEIINGNRQFSNERFYFQDNIKYAQNNSKSKTLF